MFQKKNDYDLTVWDSSDGFLKIKENLNGCRFYVDVDNRYDKQFDSVEALESYLESVKADFVGYDSLQEWGLGM